MNPPFDGSSKRDKLNSAFTCLVILVIGLASAFPLFSAAPLLAQDIQKGDDSAIQSVSIGFEGKVVLGRWVPVSVKLSPSIADVELKFETLDGDAVPIQYVENGGVQGVNSRVPALVRIGRATGMTVKAVDGDGQVVARRRFTLDELQERHSYLPGTSRLTLFLGVTSAQQESLELGRQFSDVSVVVSGCGELPTHWLGYDSIATLVIAPKNEFETNLDGPRISAIEQWIQNGGRGLVTGGPAFGSWFDNHLASLSPGKLVGTLAVEDSGSIELFTGATDQLVASGGTPLSVTAIDNDSSDMTTHKSAGLAGAHHLITHWLFGFGRMTFISLDFTEEPVNTWQGRERLLMLAMDDAGATPGESQSSQSGRISHIGYTDITGQLRAGLDQFNRVSFVTFALVALLVGLFILAIGPGDYFFLRKVTGRMELTWLTFTLICLAFCGLAWLLASTMKSSETELNQVEFIDIDGVTGQARGNLWTHVYSPGTGDFDVAMPNENKLLGQINEGWIAWEGLPGGGLGSMQSRTDVGLYRRQYNCETSVSGSTLTEIPMQNASTKTFFGTWRSQSKQKIIANLRQSPNSDALLGNLTNPFDQQLYDAVVLYGDWVYILSDRPLESDETIIVEDDLQEKTIAGYFTRLGGRGSDEVNAAWDSQGTNLPRILQMMSFFDAIGGEAYTQLTNDFHSNIDLSYQLKMGNAVLIGQIPTAATPLAINGKTFNRYDKRLSLVRIVLPVQPRK